MRKDLLMWDETLFRDPEVLEIDYVPEQFEFRDAQMRELAFQIRPGLRGGRPMNTVCKGLPGTGKTTSIIKLFSEIEESTKKLVPVYINCQIDNTKFAILSQIYKKLSGRHRHPARHLSRSLMQLPVSSLKKRLCCSWRSTMLTPSLRKRDQQSALHAPALP